MKVCPKCGKQYGDDANFCTNDAGRLIAMAASAPAAAPAAAAPAANVVGGRFELGERIGGGATGEVHRAVDRQTNAAVAVKLIAPSLTAQPAAAQRIERELKLLERVAHPAAAKVLGSGKHGEQLWVATEWVEGATPLATSLSHGAIDSDRAAAIVTEIGGALLDAAKVGVVHRDLSPKNVLVAGDTIKVINFPLPIPGERYAGVPGYVPPEAIEGKPIDQRSATYSLAAIYYAAVTGAPPFDGDAASIANQQLTGTIPPPSRRAPLAPEVDQVIGRAMDRNPAKRHLTLKQFLDDIDRVRKGGEPSPASTAPFGRVGKPKELASTMLGVAPIGGGPNPGELKTRQMDVQIPVEALREAAALETVVPPAPPTAPPVMPVAPVAPVAVAVAPSQPIPQAIAEPAPSPWAAPAPAAPGPMTPAVQAVAAAAPAIGAIAAAPPPSAVATMPLPQAAPAMPAAPVMAAPVMAAPAAPSVPAGSPAQSMSGKDKGKRKDAKKKGQFRETLWFKKGDLDAVAAEEAARSGDAAAQDKVDMLPMEDRYKDDGTLTSTDAERYSLRTGQTSSMPAMRDQPGASSSVSERDLIGEMKSGRTKVFIAIGVGVVAIAVIVAMFAL
ncbi:MAG: protein kinase [Myxococcales bacterium]|nr:protein kinase [Myxococcales bacterium]